VASSGAPLCLIWTPYVACGGCRRLDVCVGCPMLHAAQLQGGVCIGSAL
jgi:hypothetical protein